MNPKKRAPEWQIRCMRCDSTEPWDQPGVRIKASGRKFVFGRCPQCKRIRLRVIEKVPDPKLHGL
jgi:Zn finger protein HypA/HybF involved in hydrogenase expression